DRPAPVTPEMIEDAEWIAGVTLSEEDRKKVARLVTHWQRGFRKLREVKLPNSVPLPLAFNPAPWLPPGQLSGSVEMTEDFAPKKPETKEDLAFLPISELAALVRTRKVSSVELTRLYLERLKDYDPALHCVVTLTEKTALEQAQRADREIAAG